MGAGRGCRVRRGPGVRELGQAPRCWEAGLGAGQGQGSPVCGSALSLRALGAPGGTHGGPAGPPKPPAGTTSQAGGLGTRGLQRVRVALDSGPMGPSGHSGIRVGSEKPGDLGAVLFPAPTPVSNSKETRAGDPQGHPALLQPLAPSQASVRPLSLVL